MDFSEFLERLNYIMELINLMSLCEAPDILCPVPFEEEEKISTVTNNSFFYGDGLTVYNKGDSTQSAESFLKICEESISHGEKETNLYITEPYGGSHYNLRSFCESGFYGAGVYNGFSNATESLMDYREFKNSDAFENSSALLNFSGFYGRENTLFRILGEKGSIFFGEAFERTVEESQWAVYGYREKDNALSGIFGIYKEANLLGEREKEAENRFYISSVYDKMYSDFVTGENVLGKCAEKTEEYYNSINQMYGLRDSNLYESSINMAERLLEKEEVYNKRYSSIRESTEGEKNTLLQSEHTGYRNITEFLRESIQKSSAENRGNVNINVDFKAYAEVKNDYDTEEFAQVFVKYLEGQLESCAEGLHY